MHIVITGGTGLIGRALTTSLAQEGHRVTVLSRDPARHPSSVARGVTVTAWDPRRPEGWAGQLSGCDAVVNLAGAGVADTRWSCLLYTSRCV